MLNKVCTKYLTKLAATSKTNISPGDGYVYRNGGWQWSPTKKDLEEHKKWVDDDDARQHVLRSDGVGAAFTPSPKKRTVKDALRSAGWSEEEIANRAKHKQQVKNYSKAISERTKHLKQRQRDLGLSKPYTDPATGKTTYNYYAGLDGYDLDHIEMINKERQSRGLGAINDPLYEARNRSTRDTEGTFSPLLLNSVYGSDPIKTWDTAVNGSWKLKQLAPVERNKVAKEVMDDPSVNYENPYEFLTAIHKRKQQYDEQVDKHNSYVHQPGTLYPDHPYYNLLSEVGKGNMDILGKLYSMWPQERQVMEDYIRRYFQVNRSLMEQAQNGQIIMPARFWDQEWFKKGY